MIGSQLRRWRVQGEKLGDERSGMGRRHHPDGVHLCLDSSLDPDVFRPEAVVYARGLK